METIKKVCAHCGVELSEEIAVNDKLYCSDCIDELFLVCDDCGEYFPKDDLTEVQNGNSVCKDCLDENYTQCEDCDEWCKNEDMTGIDNKDVCSNCRDEDYFCCERCGDWHHNDDGFSVGDEFWCEHCTDNHSGMCIDCDRRFPLDELTEVDDEMVCDRCRSNGDYYTCTSCGELHHSDNICWYDDDPYCGDCVPDEDDDDDDNDDSSGAIGSYHSHSYSRLTFYGSNYDNTVPFLGVELEVDAENRVERNRAASEMKAFLNNNGQFVYMEGDGSLNYGFESITHPATCEYHMSKTGDYEKAFQAALRNGLRSHQTNTCGLHVHFNRDYYGSVEEQDAGITRLLYLTEKFWTELTKFSRRKIHNLERWANKYNKAPIEVVADMKSRRVGRYYAVNLTNRATIEFRMFRGTLKLNTYLATLQLVNNLVVASKYITEPEKLQALTWDYFINSDILNEYWEQVKERVVR